jgi:hypothetical protein
MRNWPNEGSQRQERRGGTESQREIKQHWHARGLGGLPAKWEIMKFNTTAEGGSTQTARRVYHAEMVLDARNLLAMAASPFLWVA